MDPELAERCYSLYSSFLHSVYGDLRSLGMIIVELYLRQPLSTLQKSLFRSTNFQYTDLVAFNSMERLSKGMTQLLQLCFNPLPQNLIIESIDTNKRGEEIKYWKSSLLKAEEDLLTVLEKEFRECGGIEPRGGIKDKPQETFWTKEVQV